MRFSKFDRDESTIVFISIGTLIYNFTCSLTWHFPKSEGVKGALLSKQKISIALPYSFT